jgi:hypothetical protein
MVAITKEQQIIWDIYKDLYKESTPSADFDKLVEEAPINSMGEKDIGFMNHVISESKFDEILDRHLKGHRITKLKQLMIRNTVLLGCSPKFKKEENALQIN